MSSKSYNPANYNFTWTEDGWYAWDSKAAHAAAKAARDADARIAKASGCTVHKSASRGQRIRRGGIGTGHPEIDLVVTVYHVAVN